MSESPDAVELPDVDDETTVTAHCCNPERTVFTEEGNSDGWIATDLTVELDR
ncbi:hypothetical protein SAMN05216559_3121 [Halomicrobium zhouii]|uniref:Uncharacterized protein n=1 Tax=Halomicrobium zhouii TaxID=767519 RepID=A0A1I6LTZ7_9EURY|nr:hypothetical protein [Halomicrobium zhouii]SFS06914.1 hypothetical protein SAMN05216559_3121 [Halomicrobium zhouii]